ncbi:hypothetical protein CR492_06985 [Methylocella silvestris]|uniref:Uncharacterized protein n=1 Tax=Methylocella silvestris TaxID=199596 RepID=A0A2J7TJ14_METSI|nr:hypothetical protein CR492_06985 [Methylocella silvestris]
MVSCGAWAHRLRGAESSSTRTSLQEFWLNLADGGNGAFPTKRTERLHSRHRRRSVQFAAERV